MSFNFASVSPFKSWDGLMLLVLIFLATPVLAQTSLQEPTFGRVAVGQFAGEGESREESFTIAQETIDGLLSAGVGDQMTLASFPLAPGERGSITVNRIPVFAEGSRIWHVRGGQVEEVARDPRLFFRGASDQGDPVAFAVDPLERRLSGSIHGGGDVFELMPFASAARALHGVRRRPKPDHPDAFECANPEHSHLKEGVEVPERSADRQFLAQLNVGFPAAGRGASLRQAVIAIDTDIELLHLKFSNNTADAMTWLGNLFNEMNVMYERDLGLRLVIGETFLRTGEAADYGSDPYVNHGCPMGASNCAIPFAALSDVGNYWNSNHSDIERVFVTYFSGKQGSSNSGSGIAWVDGYCENQSTGGGYSATQVLRSSFLQTNARLIGHEIGHNAGSSHTHCYTPEVDQCYNAEPGCYGYDPNPALRDPVSCPGGPGTVMSYCHFGAPSGAACGTSDSAFHPTVQTNIEGFMDAHPACIVPLVPVDQIFVDGFETGNTSAWD